MILPRLAQTAGRAASHTSYNSLYGYRIYPKAYRPPPLGFRTFTSTPHLCKDTPRSITLQDLRDEARKESVTKKLEDPDTVRPETIEKPKPSVPSGGGSEDPLLSEQTVSNKEQRQADWAIIKEMSQYLWPKDNLGTRVRVGASVGLLIGAKVNQRLPAFFHSATNICT